MRYALARLHGQRHTFYATFVRFGKLYLGPECIRYMLVQDVCDSDGEYLTEHCYIPLRPEDYVWSRVRRWYPIRFEAEVELYIKGQGRYRQLDYGFCRPSEVERVYEQEEMEV